MSFLDPSVTEQTEVILNNPVEVHKASGYSVPGTYDNGIDTPPADDAALLRCIELLSAAHDSDTLTPSDEQLLESVWRVAFPQD
jgi:hypothetical protein